MFLWPFHHTSRSRPANENYKHLELPRFFRARPFQAGLAGFGRSLASQNPKGFSISSAMHESFTAQCTPMKSNNRNLVPNTWISLCKIAAVLLPQTLHPILNGDLKNRLPISPRFLFFDLELKAAQQTAAPRRGVEVAPKGLQARVPFGFAFVC